MSTPSDPYNSASRRPFDDDDILEPLPEKRHDDLEGHEDLEATRTDSEHDREFAGGEYGEAGTVIDGQHRPDSDQVHGSTGLSERDFQRDDVVRDQSVTGTGAFADDSEHDADLYESRNDDLHEETHDDDERDDARLEGYSRTDVDDNADTDAYASGATGSEGTPARPDGVSTGATAASVAGVTGFAAAGAARDDDGRSIDRDARLFNGDSREENRNLGSYFGDGDRETERDAELYERGALAREGRIGDDVEPDLVRDGHDDNLGRDRFGDDRNRFGDDRNDANRDRLDRADDTVITPAEDARTAPTRTSVISAQTPDDHQTGTGAAAAGATAAGTAGFMANRDRREDDVDRRERWSTDPGPADVDDIPDEPRGRGGWHVGSIFLTLLLLPVAWYLISDAGARLMLGESSAWNTGSFEWMPVLELVGGLVVLAILWMIAWNSSLGAMVIGGLVTIAGLVAIIMPNLGQDVIAWLSDTIGDYNAFTGNVVHHLNLDLGTGRVAVLGFLLFMTGVVAHNARRRGQYYGNAVTRRSMMLKDHEIEK